MRVNISQLNRIPIGSSPMVSSYESNGDQRIDEGRLLSDYTKENTVNEMGVRQENRTRGNAELQLMIKQQEQQNEMILELQKQMQNLAAIHFQQQRQKLLNEEAMRRMQEKTAQKSAVKEAESMRMQPGVDEIGIVPKDKLPARPASNEANSLDGPDSIPSCALRRIRKQTERSKFAIDAKPNRQLRKLSQTNSLRKKKKKQVNEREEICNIVDSKNSSAYVRKNSTLYLCKDCGKQFTQKGNMNTHLRIHTGEKPFKCGECDRVFAQAVHLKVHQRIHSGEKPFKCGECNGAFAQAGHLTVHQRIHSGEKPFKCQICKAAFSQKTHLSTHLMIHTNEKPFLCDICQRWFRQKSILREHMKIHSGLKPWKCNVCQKLFRQKSTLNTHRKLHSGVED